jgi:hypothetical protein
MIFQLGSGAVSTGDRMKWPPTICLLITLGAGFVSPVYSQPATSPSATHPATNPATTSRVTTHPSAVTVESAYIDLGSADPLVRGDARMFLMGLSRDDLPALKEVVKSHLPASAGQAVALREVVTSVYLADDSAETTGKEGFLGVAPLMGEDSISVPDPDHPGNVLTGVNFASRTPGSCAYRWLAEGDVIVAMGTDELQPVMSFMDLSRRIRQIAPGTVIRMKIFRSGGLLTLRFPLDARPTAADDFALFQAMLDQRLARLETYWKKTFGPLVDPDFT